MANKSKEFKRGAIWAIKKVYSYLPILGDEVNADLVYYLECIGKSLDRGTNRKVRGER